MVEKINQEELLLLFGFVAILNLGVEELKSVFGITVFNVSLGHAMHISKVVLTLLEDGFIKKLIEVAIIKLRVQQGLSQLEPEVLILLTISASIYSLWHHISFSEKTSK